MAVEPTYQLIKNKNNKEKIKNKRKMEELLREAHTPGPAWTLICFARAPTKVRIFELKKQTQGCGSIN
jgi:hypothetical protein